MMIDATFCDVHHGSSWSVVSATGPTAAAGTALRWDAINNAEHPNRRDATKNDAG